MDSNIHKITEDMGIEIPYARQYNQQGYSLRTGLLSIVIIVHHRKYEPFGVYIYMPRTRYTIKEHTRMVRRGKISISFLELLKSAVMQWEEGIMRYASVHRHYQYMLNKRLKL